MRAFCATVDRVSQTTQAGDPRAVHSARLERARQRLVALDRTSGWIANGRTVAFVGAIALAALWYFGKLGAWAGACAPVSLAVYVLFAVWHQRVFQSERRARGAVRCSERGLARLDGSWHDFRERGDAFVDGSHLYTSDLDVFGQGSLFQLLNETGTAAGERRLAAILRMPAPLETVRERQAALRELSAQIDFREALAVEGGLVADHKPDPAAFIAWAEQAPSLDSIRWAQPFAWLGPVASVVLFVLRQLGLVPPALWWIGVALTVGVAAITRTALGRYWDALTAGELAMARYERLFALLAAPKLEHPLLRRLTGIDGGSAEAALRRFSRRFSFADLRRTQLHAVIQLLTLWDVHWFFALERWRALHGARVRSWFEALAELEALSSLAVLVHDRPRFVFPALSETGPRLVASSLAHPLLDGAVPNDVALPSPRTALLITGSNMSGKTTLVRAMGLNAVLALTGAPVCAQSMELSELSIATSMRVKDSLERGVSYFYAEVQRLKAVLDEASRAQGRTLFLLDEILLGTNTRERQIASREVLRQLLATGAIGAVTTHDLSLAELEAESAGAVKNVHFRDLLVGGQMTFDYRLQPGVVATTNALRVLAQAGIPVPDASG